MPQLRKQPLPCTILWLLRFLCDRSSKTLESPGSMQTQRLHVFLRLPEDRISLKSSGTSLGHVDCSAEEGRSSELPKSMLTWLERLRTSGGALLAEDLRISQANKADFVQAIRSFSRGHASVTWPVDLGLCRLVFSWQNTGPARPSAF